MGCLKKCMNETNETKTLTDQDVKIIPYDTDFSDQKGFHESFKQMDKVSKELSKNTLVLSGHGNNWKQLINHIIKSQEDTIAWQDLQKRKLKNTEVIKFTVEYDGEEIRFTDPELKREVTEVENENRSKKRKQDNTEV